MRVWLTRKFSDVLNGCDLSKVRSGHMVDVSARDAAMLVAEGWAEPIGDGGAPGPDRAHDRTARVRRPQARKKR